MNKLEMYKQLSNEDKTNLTIYCIYDNIYNTIKDSGFKIEDDKILDIQELSYDLYLEDDYYNLSISKIASFITECYMRDNEFLEKIDDIEYLEILQAIDDDDLDFYKDEEFEMER